MFQCPMDGRRPSQFRDRSGDNQVQETQLGKRKRTILLALTLLGMVLAVGLGSSPAFGASSQPPTIKTMKVSVQPEYDDPRIMVTYQGEFEDGAAFPQDVAFAMPMGSEVNMVCALKPPNDEHLCQLYKAQATSDQLSVSYTLPIPTYYLEYYWDGLKNQQPSKSFTYTYTAPYPISSLDLEVQQPLKATNFTLDQPYASTTSDGQGFKYYHYTYNNVTQGQVIKVSATYTKPDNTPSVKKQTSSGSTTTASSGGSNATTMVAIGAALLMAGVVGFLLLRRKPAPVHARAAYSNAPVGSRRERRLEARLVQAQRLRPQTTPRPPANKPVQAQTHSPADQTSAAFCTQCGGRLASGAAFCHVCGAQARTS